MATSPRPPLLSRDFCLITAANSLFMICMASFFILPKHLEVLGAREGEIGFIMGSFGVACLLVITPVGMLLDRHGRRPFLIIGSLLMAASSMAFILPEALGPPFYLLRALQGAAFAFFHTAGLTLAADYSPPEQRTQAIGLFGVFALAAHALGPMTGEWVVEHYGFPHLFLAAGAMALLGLGLAVMVREPKLGRSMGVPVRMVQLIRKRGVLVPALTTVAIAAGFGSVLTFLPTYTLSLDLPRVGPFFGAYALGAIVVRIFLGGLADRVGRRRVILPSVACYALSIAALSPFFSAVSPCYIPGEILLVLVGLAFGTCHGFNYPAMNTLMIERHPADRRGKVTALYSGSFTLGFTMNAYTFGPVAEAIGYGGMYLVAAAVVATAFLFFLVADRGETTVEMETEAAGRPAPAGQPPI